jgi:hypothetical protein
MAVNLGQTAVPSASNCQGQLQTPQSVSVPATAGSPISSSQQNFARNRVLCSSLKQKLIKGLLSLYLAKPR